jgi:HD-like signal output (HDOD) protein
LFGNFGYKVTMVSPNIADTVILQAENLPSLSPTAVKLIRMLDNPDIARSTVADTLNLDEILAASVFKYANSAIVAARVRFTNMIAVIDYIGLDSIKDIVFLVAAKQVIKDESLWRRSVFISNTVKKLTKEINETKDFNDLSFMLALFYNLGSLVFRIYYRDEYQQSLALTDFQKRLAKEKSIFGLNHLELSAIILKRWKFPEELIDLVKSQADYTSDKFTKHNTLVEISRRLFELEEVNESNIKAILTDDKLKKKINQYNLSHFDFTEDFVNKLFDEAETTVSAW